MNTEGEAISRVHWSIIGYDEHGDQDGELCRCEIGESHAAGAKVTDAEATVRRVREFVDGFAERGGGHVNKTDELWILALRKVLDGEEFQARELLGVVRGEDERDLATELAERGLRACCGLPSERHCQ